ncbi:MAG: isoprenylcysteine carboxylmethyltransferase family protein [Ignavibacteria bacterium]|nr:isoprenylcysteine carboxylmethyltransferase family protein [Ignavibacteria bacterium]
MNYDILINLIIIINIVLTFSANIPLASFSFKKKLQPVLTRANSYLQNYPKLISAIIFLLIIAGLFGFGRVEIENPNFNFVRIIAALMYTLFSWIQIYSAKQLGEFYSPDIVVYKNHKVIDKGLYKFIRHPFYISQILQDIFAGIALSNWIILLITIVLEVPLYVARANVEEKLLLRNLDEYKDYQNRVGKWFPKLR